MNVTSHSLVIPVYRNEESIPTLLESLEELNAALDSDLEVVFVIDGSPDRSYELLRAGLPAVPFPSRLIRLSRNFGAFEAIREGLAAAHGPSYASMAADQQEPPELIVDFFRALSEEDVDLVVGRRVGRGDPALTRWSAQTFWALYRLFVQPQMPRGGIDTFGMNQAVRNTLVSLTESHSSLVGQLIWLGYRRKEIPYTRRSRRRGHSAWSLRKRLRYMADSVFSFTDLPIRVLGAIGAIGSALTIVAAFVVSVAYIRGRILTPGYTPLVLAILFSTFVTLLGLAVVGNYVWRVYENSKHRPSSLRMSDEAFPGEARR